MTWLCSLYRRWMDRHDAEAKTTGYTFTTPATYDYQKARAGFQKAQRHTASGRVIPKPRKAQRASVTPLRRVSR